MRMPKNEFLSCLEKVYPAVGKNEIIKDRENFQINKDVVWAYNGNMMIRTNLPCDTGLKCGVPARHFLQLLRSLDTEEVELTDKNRSIHIKAGAINATVGSLPLPFYKHENLTKPKSTCRDTKAISDLIESLNLCKFVPSNSWCDRIYKGVKLDKDTVISTDRNRIAVCSLGSKFPWTNCVLPIKLINLMNKVKDDICEVGYSSDKKYFVVLLTDKTYIGCRTLEDLPNLLHYFPKSDSPCVQIHFTNEIGSMIERHNQFLVDVPQIDKEIFLHIHKYKCVVTSKDKYIGSLTEELELSNHVKSEFEFYVNPVFLKDVAKGCSVLHWYPDEEKILLETEKLRHLTLSKEEANWNQYELTNELINK